MQNFVDVLTACQNAGGAGKKAAIQAALSTADTTTRKLFWHAMNPYITFGVRKWKIKSPYGTLDDPTPFFDLLEALAARELTGNAASDTVANVLSMYPKHVADLLELVIEKDLKAGFSEDTYNIVLMARGEYGHVNDANYKLVKRVYEGGTSNFVGNPFYNELVPTFTVMLADKCETPEEFLEKITFPCQADFKYDGQRTVCFVTDKGVTYYARSGKESEHLKGVFDDELARIRAHVQTDFVLDGEAFASDFTETMNAKKDGNDAAKANLRLRAFFLMPMSHWISRNTENTMRSCRAALTRILSTTKCQKIILTEGREVKDYADMVAYCNEVIDVHKQEGLILKNWDSTYQWDRTMDWCKVKRFNDVDAKIVGWYKGRPKSRLENTCGGISIEAVDEKGREIRCNVGSGFSDEQRADIAANYDRKYHGTTVVITYQEISQAKDSEYFALRFPTIKQLLRDDKPL